MEVSKSGNAKLPPALQIVGLVVLCLFVFFIDLGGPQLWDRDEPRNAGCALEMMERGDMIVPMFNGELRFQKPVLLYWLIISAYEVFGVNEFAARFWSAVLATGSVLLTYLFSSRLFGRTVGLMAGAILATNLMFDVAGRAATPDSVLIFFSTLTITLFVFATYRPFSNQAELRIADEWFPFGMGWAIAIYSATGLATLAKGPVGFLIPCAVIGMYLLILTRARHREPNVSLEIENSEAANGSHWFLMGMRQVWATINPVHFLKTVWRMKPIVLIVMVLGIAGPWFYWVGVRTNGDFTQLFFVGEHFGRATTSLEGHSGGIWFYPVAILCGFFPWSVFWWPVALDLWNRKGAARMPPPVILMLCWIGVQVGLFSLSQTKLPSYVTPCYPALAVLTSYCLANWARQVRGCVSDFWMLGAQGGLVFGGGLLTAGLVYLCYKEINGSWWLVGIGLIPVVVGIVGLLLAKKGQRYGMLQINLAGAFCLLIGLFGVGAGEIGELQNNRKILDPIAASDQETKVATFRCLESSWTFYGRKVFYELDAQIQPQTFAATASLYQSEFWKPKNRLSPESFGQAFPDSMFITSEEHVDELKKRLPGDYEIIRTADYLFRNKKLCLLARRATDSID